jgi:hypothetical protein
VTMQLSGHLPNDAGVTYWRACGEWGVSAHYKDGKLVAWSSTKALVRVIGLELMTITQREWAKENENVRRP